MNFSSITSNFLDIACTKIQNMAFKTSKMDQIALEYWYNSFLGRLRVDGRGFLHQKPTLKKRSPEQKSRCRTCAETCHSPFNTKRVNFTSRTLIISVSFFYIEKSVAFIRGIWNLAEWFVGWGKYSWALNMNWASETVSNFLFSLV